MPYHSVVVPIILENKNEIPIETRIIAEIYYDMG